ncbi:aldolase [Acidipila sp. EB88]|uniref:aldolase n=1 Tax=Acidipila sp. EB88 TaxID=2305226 RepID=UPI001F332DAE|nr:aldolase [Acidipila sp. EB88]
MSKPDAPQASRPQDALRSSMDLPLSKTFYPLGFAVEVITNHPAVLRAAIECFGHISSCRATTQLQVRVGISRGGDAFLPSEPTRREYNHLYSLVADTHNQALLDLETGINFAWLSEAALMNPGYLRTNFLEKIVYLLLGAKHVTDVHAACVSRFGRGILLCGDSGAGKSTLAYACARAGWCYTSDDTSYLINGLEYPLVTGHAHRVRFRPTARELFPELADREATPRMEGKPSIELPVAELPLHSTSTDARIDAIIYLNRFAGAQGRLAALPKGTATERMQQDLFSAGDLRARHAKQLEIFTNVPTYSLEYCELPAAIAQVDQLARGL